MKRMFVGLALAFILAFSLVGVAVADDQYEGHEDYYEEGYEHAERGHDGHHDERHGYMLLVASLIGAVALAALVMSIIALRRVASASLKGPTSGEALPSAEHAPVSDVVASDSDSTPESDPDPGKKDS